MRGQSLARACSAKSVAPLIAERRRMAGMEASHDVEGDGRVDRGRDSRRRQAPGEPVGGRQNLLAEPRRMKILEWLQEEGSARVRDLSVAFAVSEATIRQDLERLDNDGFVVREHGGAYLKSVPQQVQSMSLQHLTNMDRKKRIGRAAASLVHNGETIILDSGSTTTEIANNLTGHQNLN